MAGDERAGEEGDSGLQTGHARRRAEIAAQRSSTTSVVSIGRRRRLAMLRFPTVLEYLHRAVRQLVWHEELHALDAAFHGSAYADDYGRDFGVLERKPVEVSFYLRRIGLDSPHLVRPRRLAPPSSLTRVRC